MLLIENVPSVGIIALAFENAIQCFLPTLIARSIHNFPV
jgi:hypothetical protein